jgi:hypothetical protein
VVPIDANTLAVVSDDVHASAVGLYLANIASCGLADFFVHAARDAEDNEEAIRSLLPNMLERALEYLPSERWSILGRSPDGLRVVRRRISDADPTSSPSSPFHHLESKNLDVLNFTTAPALDWGAGTNGGDRIVFPAIRPATIRMHPLGSIVAMLRSAKVPARPSSTGSEPAATHSCAKTRTQSSSPPCPYCTRRLASCPFSGAYPTSTGSSPPTPTTPISARDTNSSTGFPRWSGATTTRAT